MKQHAKDFMAGSVEMEFIVQMLEIWPWMVPAGRKGNILFRPFLRRQKAEN